MKTWALKEIKKRAIEIGRTYAISEKHYNRLLNKIVGKTDIRNLRSPVFPILVFNKNGYLFEF